MNYSYAVRGDGQIPTQMIPPDIQRRALEVVLWTLRPEIVAVPEHILHLIPPRAPGVSGGRETFKGRTGVTFDPLAASECAAGLTAQLLLNPQRAARLVEFQARDSEMLGFEELLKNLIEATWKTERSEHYYGEVQRIVERTVLYYLMQLAANADTTHTVRTLSLAALTDLKGTLEKQDSSKDALLAAHNAYAIGHLSQFLLAPFEVKMSAPAETPPGSPIGNAERCGAHWFGR
jgi:hypothetical protein